MIILKWRSVELTSGQIEALKHCTSVVHYSGIIIHRVSVAVELLMLFAASAKAPEGSDTPRST
jgi:hypothetical protein